MKVYTRTTITSLECDADDWELYQNEGREAAAMRLNAGIVAIVNAHSDKNTVWAKCAELLSQESDFGANDSEGHSCLDWILSNVFSK